MDTKKIIKQLQRDYPGKKIIKLPENNPEEILCEYELTEKHPDWSEAISVINKSVPHYHKKMTETYEVLNGDLVVHVNGKKHKIKKGETFVIEPNQIHWAEGDETWIKVLAKPGWTVKDHILIKTNKPRI